MCRHCEISKKLTLNPTMPAKNTPLSLLSDMGLSLKIFTLGIPLHDNVFSFTHNAVVLWLFRCVHPENQTKNLNFKIFVNQNKCRLHKTWTVEVIARTTLCSTSIVLVQRQTDLLLCTVNCFPQWALPQNMAVSDLAFYHTLCSQSGINLKGLSVTDHSKLHFFQTCRFLCLFRENNDSLRNGVLLGRETIICCWKLIIAGDN